MKISEKHPHPVRFVASFYPFETSSVNITKCSSIRISEVKLVYVTKSISHHYIYESALDRHGHCFLTEWWLLTTVSKIHYVYTHTGMMFDSACLWFIKPSASEPRRPPHTSPGVDLLLRNNTAANGPEPAIRSHTPCTVRLHLHPLSQE